MKKILLLVLMFTACFEGFSQEVIKFKKGYVGISLGWTVHTGSSFGPITIVPESSVDPGQNQQPTILDPVPNLKPGSVGININLIDAGYTFGKHWGIALKWQGGAHVSELNGDTFVSSFGMIMLGPMYTLNLQDDLELDIKLRGGRMYFGNDYTIGNGSGGSLQENINFGLEFGGSLRYHFAPKWSWINNLEFQNQFTEYSDERINRINLSTGIAFRF
jgi:hypothetical protein